MHYISVHIILQSALPLWNDALDMTISAIKQRRWERKGPSEIIQKFRLRNWPISSADLPITPIKGTEHHFAPF